MEAYDYLVSWSQELKLAASLRVTMAVMDFYHLKTILIKNNTIISNNCYSFDL